jgi:hypothetical protein
MEDLDITEEELQEAHAFLDNLLVTSRKEAISRSLALCEVRELNHFDVVVPQVTTSRPGL